MIRGVMIRVLLSVTSAMVAAWFILGATQAHELSQATSIAGQANVSEAQARHARALLDSAGRLNPDLQVDVVRALIAEDRGQVSNARRILQRVTQREPDDLQAWAIEGQLPGNPKPLIRTIFRHIVGLEPPVAYNR